MKFNFNNKEEIKDFNDKCEKCGSDLHLEKQSNTMSVPKFLWGSFRVCLDTCVFLIKRPFIKS